MRGAAPIEAVAVLSCDPWWRVHRRGVPCSSSSSAHRPGGIEALSRLVADLPGDFGAAIVIAQHLDPRRPSHLAEILERHATLPVRVIADGDRLAEGVIHVVPPNRLVEVVDDGAAAAARAGRDHRAVDRPAAHERGQGLRRARRRGRS